MNAPIPRTAAEAEALLAQAIVLLDHAQKMIRDLAAENARLRASKAVS